MSLLRRYLFQIRVRYDFKPLIFGSRLPDPENWSATLKAPWTAKSDFFSRAETTLITDRRTDIYNRLLVRCLWARRPRCEVRRSRGCSLDNFSHPVEPHQYLFYSDRDEPRPKSRSGKDDLFPRPPLIPWCAGLKIRLCAVLLGALLSGTDAAIVTDAGTYGTSNNLTTSQAVSTKVKEIVDLIDGTESGLAAAQIKFAEDGSLKDMASDVCNNKCDKAQRASA